MLKMEIGLIELILFGMLNIPIIYFSRRNILVPKSHGFYRFLSWECIAWLFVNNYLYWFEEPFSFYQILSWIFLFYSIFLVVSGVLLLNKKGEKNKSRKDESLFSFEKTTELVESGLYKYIRHPMYGSLLFLTLGIFFKNVASVPFVFTILSSIFLFITAKIEDKENIAYFGDKYEDYIKRTRMFVPFLI